MDYSIAEIAKLLNTSKVTIYNKIARIKELKEHVKKTKNGRCVDEFGFELIKSSLIDNPYIKDFNEGYEKEEEQINENVYETNSLNDLSGVIKELKNELNDLKQAMKNNVEKEDISVVLNLLKQQLESKDNQIESLTKLNENSQVLLSQAQQRIFYLEVGETKKTWWKFWKS